MDEIKIDMKNGIVTIRDIVIDMEKQTIVMGVAKKPAYQIVRGITPTEQIPSQPSQKKLDTHKPISASKRKKYKVLRKRFVNTEVLMPDENLWLVKSHVRGSLYTIEKSSIRGDRKTQLGTAYTEKRDASHSKKKGWVFWKDKGTNTKRKRKKSMNKIVPKHYYCGRCKLKNHNIATCNSVQRKDGTWVHQHKDNSYYLGQKNNTEGWIE